MADVRALPAAACHEAGHAVAAVLLGLTLVQVFIQPDGRKGRCFIAEPDEIYLRLQESDEEAVRWAEHKMVYLAAGVEAERALRGATSSIGDDDDRNNINNLLAYFIPPPEMTAPTADLNEYDRAVEERRSSVYAQAAALLSASDSCAATIAVATLVSEKGTVSDTEVRETVRAYMACAEVRE